MSVTTGFSMRKVSTRIDVLKTRLIIFFFFRSSFPVPEMSMMQDSSPAGKYSWYFSPPQVANLLLETPCNFSSIATWIVNPLTGDVNDVEFFSRKRQYCKFPCRKCNSHEFPLAEISLLIFALIPSRWRPRCVIPLSRR